MFNKATHGLAHGSETAGTIRRASTVWSDAQASANSADNSNPAIQHRWQHCCGHDQPGRILKRSAATSIASAVSASNSGKDDDKWRLAAARARTRTRAGATVEISPTTGTAITESETATATEMPSTNDRQSGTPAKRLPSGKSFEMWRSPLAVGDGAREGRS